MDNACAFTLNMRLCVVLYFKFLRLYSKYLNTMTLFLKKHHIRIKVSEKLNTHIHLYVS